MQTKDFYYDLPEELIAQKPLLKRDESRLLVYDRTKRTIEHRSFKDILDYLNPGDALVINNTKVIPARLFGTKQTTGADVEVLLLNRREKDLWEAILRPGKKLKLNDTIIFDETTKAQVLEKYEGGVTLLQFAYAGLFEAVLDRLGNMPLPPYIHEKLDDKNRYQTVYALTEGSAAAPTAGLHFTQELLQKIRKKGVAILEVLLHVGLGTFRPVKTKNIDEHHMHAEYYEISGQTAEAYNRIRAEGGKIFAVGTTTVRTLETVADAKGNIREARGTTEIFIFPGYEYKTVDRLITNFHLPESTLLMLVSAFAGHEETMRLYKEAVSERYRFFSFGDAMLIL